MSKAKKPRAGAAAESTVTDLFPKKVADQAQDSARPSPLSAYTGSAVSLPDRIFGVGWAISDRCISSNDPRHVATVVTVDQASENGKHGEPRTTVTRRFILEMRP